MKFNKYIFLFLLFLLSVSPCFAKSLKNGRVGVVSESVGISSDVDALLLNGAVKDKIESNLKKYTEITIVSTNIPELKTLQKETQESGIDKNTAVRMGKLMAADSLMNATVRKSNSNYSVSVKVIDLTTGEVLASVQKTAANSDALWAGNGCSIDLITIDLCDALGIDLSASQKYVLKYGEKDLSSDEQLKLYKADCDKYQKLIDDYNKELSLLDYSTDIDAKERQIAIEAQREIAEQKLASSLAAQQRIEELRKLRLEEDKKDAERTEEQKKKRQEIEAQAQKKVNEIRNEKKSKTTTLEEIAYIENEKKVYIEIRDSVNGRIEEIEAEKETELQQVKDEIYNQPYRKAHLDADGNPIAEAIEERRKLYSEKAAEVRAAKSKEVDAVKKSVSDNMSELLSIIDSDTAKLAKTKRKATSVSDDLSVVIGLYDGSQRAWIAHLFYTVDGRDLYQQEITLSYETVTGKKITSIMDSDYLDTVDLYDSLFSRGTPVIIFELEYTVEAMPKDRPSIYKFNFNTLTLKDSQHNLKVIEKKTLDRTKMLHITPAYDIRTEEELYLVVKAEEKQQKIQKTKTAVRNTMTKLHRDSWNFDFEWAIANDKNSVDEYGFGFGYDHYIAGPLFLGGKFAFVEPYYDSNKKSTSSSRSSSKKSSSSSEYEVGFYTAFYAGVYLPLSDGLLDVYGKVGMGAAAQYMNNSGFLYTGVVGMEFSVIQIECNIDAYTDGKTNTRISIGFSTNNLD